LSVTQRYFFFCRIEEEKLNEVTLKKKKASVITPGKKKNVPVGKKKDSMPGPSGKHTLKKKSPSDDNQDPTTDKDKKKSKK